MNRSLRQSKGICISLFLIFLLLSLSSCVSHLKEAKFYYAQAESSSRQYRTEDAIASYKRAMDEAGIEVKQHPSAQAYMLKGMAELNLQMWKEAEQSFLSALSHGFEKAEEWAQEVSLLGLASTLEEFGVEHSVLDVYSHLLETSKLRQVSFFAAQRYMDLMLKRALSKGGEDREKILSDSLKTAEKLTQKDLSCSFYHYLLSQVLSHLSEYERSFEEAVVAKELGLPTEKVSRDNDLQIVFCYQMLKEKLSAPEWKDFEARYMKWVERWKWKGPETPTWKKEATHAARD